MNIIQYPLLTEKSMGFADKENKLVFVVDIKANKSEIKQAIEKEYGIKIIGMSTHITMKGQKRAIVQLSKEHSAEDIITKVGGL